MREKMGDAEFAGRVKTLREKKGWSQETLAEAADISLSHLRKLEYEWTLGSKTTQEKLAKALGTTSIYLLYGDARQSLELPPGLTSKDVEFLRYIATYLAESNNPESESEKTDTTTIKDTSPIQSSSNSSEENFDELEKDAEFLSDIEIVEEINRLSNILLQRKKKL